VPSFGPTSLDPNIKPMSQDNLNFGVEYQLSPSMVFRGSYVHTNLLRTMEDVGVIVEGDEHYVQVNPGEGLGEFVRPNGLTPGPIRVPKPKRTYDAMELSVVRRFSNGWFGSASYVFSRLYGNYAGLASSDEIRTPTTGVTIGSSQQAGGNIYRSGGNANRAFDLDELLFDARGTLDVRGRLATDRPHVMKLYGSKLFSFGSDKHGSEIGGFFYAGSGTPLSTNVVTLNHTEVFVNGRGDMGRTPFLTQTDLLVAHEVKLGEVKKLRFELNMLNLFNQKTSRHRFIFLNRGAGLARDSSAIDLSETDLSKGYDYRALLNQTEDQTSGFRAYDPRYGLDDLFNTGFQGRFGIKFTF
jgi:hypothetical protein